IAAAVAPLVQLRQRPRNLGPLHAQVVRGRDVAARLDRVAGVVANSLAELGRGCLVARPLLARDRGQILLQPRSPLLQRRAGAHLGLLAEQADPRRLAAQVGQVPVVEPAVHGRTATKITARSPRSSRGTRRRTRRPAARAASWKASAWLV